MTIVNFILILCAIIAIIWGTYTLYVSFKKAKKINQHNTSSGEIGEKDGLLILPRHERPEYQTENQINDEQQAVNKTDFSQEQPAHTQAESNQQETTSLETQSDILVNQHNQTTTTSTTAPEQLNVTAENVLPEDDAFSALASATQSITPTVQSFDERKLKKEGFNETSPILDNHIQTQVDNDQNSPLNNATQNLNISLFPNEQFSRISGRDLLNLFDKYGLKYGTMNMFHRYENKDGTGLLWFSVMMVTEDGIMPFDLNKLPNQYVKGLVMFVALPHPEAYRGFDSMISISGLLAQDLHASLYDEAGDPLTKENVQQMRELAINFAK